MAFVPRAAFLIAFCAAVAACGGGGGGSPAPAAHPPVVAQPPVVPPPQNRPPVQTTKEGFTTLELSARTPIQIDLSMGGTVFSDPDGDPLTYYLRRAGETRTETGPWLTLEAGDPAVPSDPAKLIGGQFSITIMAFDPAGDWTEHLYQIERLWNRPPVVANPNRAAFAAANEPVSRDLLQGGSTFRDPDGDPMTYAVEITAPPGQDFSVQGTDAAGRLDAAGLAGRFVITATDNFGASGADVFVVATAVPEPGRPVLLTPGYEYEDERLPLPWPFMQSRGALQPFWDTAGSSIGRDNGSGFPTNAGATLGRVLFYDKRLSVTNTHSCASCHLQPLSFTTAERFPTGVMGTPLRRNAMQLANVRYNLQEDWFGDLRAHTLEELVLMPTEDPTELGNLVYLVEEKLAATDFYPPLFEAAFGTPEVTAARIARAVSQFLRTIITYRSRYDQAYLSMDPPPAPLPDPARVLTAEELRGADIFVASHCTDCHQTDLQTLELGALNNGLDMFPADPGEVDGRFRAPSLRNIAVSAPYMHDGRFAGLREVIEHYDHGVVDSGLTSFLMRDDSVAGAPIRRLNLSEDDKNALEAFLNTLTDTEMLTDPKFSDPF